MLHKIQLFSTSLLGLTLSIAVCLMGVHAKELTALTGAAHGHSKDHSSVKKVTGSDDQAAMKIQHDPHNHVDHQTSKSIVKAFGDQSGMQADARSLRKVRHQHRKQPILNKLRFSLRLLPIGA